jgi:hypothetical protein
MFLVGVTSTNLLFAKNVFKKDFEEVALEEAMLALDPSRFGLAYDGTLVRFSTSGQNTSQDYYQAWGSTFISQPIPKFLRGYPPKLPILRLAYFSILAFASNPIGFFKFLRIALTYVAKSRGGGGISKSHG